MRVVAWPQHLILDDEDRGLRSELGERPRQPLEARATAVVREALDLAVAQEHEQIAGVVAEQAVEVGPEPARDRLARRPRRHEHDAIPREVGRVGEREVRILAVGGRDRPGDRLREDVVERHRLAAVRLFALPEPGYGRQPRYEKREQTADGEQGPGHPSNLRTYNPRSRGGA